MGGDGDQREPLSADAQQRLVEALGDFVVLVDRDRRYRWVNRLAEGVDEARFYRSRMDDFIHPSDLPKAVEAVERCFETGEVCDYQVGGYGDGSQQWIYDTHVVPATSVEGEPRALLITRNVTEQVRANQRLAQYLEASPDFIMALDGEGRILYVNRTEPPFTREAVLGLPATTFAPVAERAATEEGLRRVLDRREPADWETGGAQEADTRRFSIRGIPVEGPGETRAICTIHDITDRLRAEHAIRTSEARTRLAVSEGQVGFWELDLDSMTGSITPELADAIGLPSEGVPLDRILDRYLPEDRASLAEAVEAAAAGAEGFELEHRLVSADGRVRWYIERARRVEAPDGRASLHGIALDVTEVRRAQAREEELRLQLERAQRMESIGVLAGGIAHDFNNLLTIILGGTRLALDALRERPDVAEDLESVHEAAERAAALTAQLLAFGRKTPLEVRGLDLGALVDRVVSMTRRLIPATIEVSYDRPSEPALVMGDAGRLEQVLVNLCINGRDAMEHGGQLHIRIVVQSDVVTVSVRDTGEGIAKEHLDRVFEPFFTTKPLGRGTGLGLAMVHGIVEQHGGAIRVTSELGEGTTFTLEVPRAHDEQERDAPHRETTTPTGRGTILVADDEPMIARMVKRTLERHGYSVEIACDGLEAVELFDPQPERFDLVLLDVVMPRLDGWRAYQAIRERSRTVPVLFSSGYSTDANREALSDCRCSLLPKPYETKALLAAVAASLSDAASVAD